MNNGHSLLKVFTTIGLILTLGASMSACALVGGTSWKEEVLLHDGSKIVVKRSVERGGRHEIGQQPPIKEQSIAFSLPTTNERIAWKSEYSEDIGRSNFSLLALHILNSIPYVIASPSGCLIYDKLGRPNPPYIFFKYDGRAWQRIPLSEFPVEFKTINVVISTYGHGDVDRAVRSGFISVESVKKLNSDAKQAEFKTIVRTPIDPQGACPPPTGPDGLPIPINTMGGKK